jgi:hypothetical protein
MTPQAAPQPILRTDRLILRPFVEEDAPRLAALAGTGRVADTTGLIPHPYSPEVTEPVLLRPGVIPLPEIEEAIGPVRIAPNPVEGPHASPGMHVRHYRRRTRLLLLGDGEAAPPGRGAWLRIGREMPSDPVAYAASLYGALHRPDTEGWDWIAVERPPETPKWSGVLDRLRRAAG